MGKIAFVFAGQGAQYPGMGREISEISQRAKDVFLMADAIRPGTMDQCFHASKEELSVTINTQPCLFTVDLAVAEAVAEALISRGIRPEGVAGFSLGEIPALTFAGIFDGDGKEEEESKRSGQETGFRLVVKRGEAMNRAAEARRGGMAAVMKLSPDRVEELCAEQEGLWPVNYNSPAQTVVAGEKEVLSGFSKRVKEAGGMAMPLAVSGAFHSPHMETASQELAEVLQDISCKESRIAVYSNRNAEPYPREPQQIRELIATQVKSPVLWQKTVEQMRNDGFDTFIEVGPGKTLSGLIQKIWPEAKVYHVEDQESLRKTVDALTEPATVS